MSTVIKLRRDTNANWSGYVLSEGEIGILLSGSGNNTSIEGFKIGDGHSTWQQLNQNWKAPISTIVVSGKTASISSATASVSLSDVYASSGSQISAISSSYTASSGRVNLSLSRPGLPNLTSSFTISELPVAATASVARELRTQYASILYSGSTAEKVPNDSYGWTGIPDGDYYSIVQIDGTEANVIFKYREGLDEIFFDGTCRQANRAVRDEVGNVIYNSYVRTNQTGSQTISGSLNFLGTVTASVMSGSTGSFNDLSVQNLGVNGEGIFGDGISVAESSWIEYLDISDGLEVHSHISASGNIYAGGNVFAAGDVVAAYISDRRLKKNVEPISSQSADEVLEALKPVEFEWNEKAEELSEGHRTGKARGFIADEFLEVLPNAGKKVWEEYDAIEYIQVIPYLVAGYQKLKKEVEDLKKEIAELKNGVL